MRHDPPLTDWKATPHAAPAVSVIVPTFDRPAGLRRCVAAVLAQSATDLEFIVVDDGGRLPAADALAGFDDPRLRVIRQDNAGPAAARNCGASLARAALLAFVDDDCAPRRDWLERLLAKSRACPGAMVGGTTHNALAADAFAEASQQLIHYLYARLNADAGDASFLTSNNMLLPADGFAEAGGFDQTYRRAAGEDRQFCRAWKALGRAICVEASAVVDHYHAMGLRGYLKQHFDYGRGAYRYHRLMAGEALAKAKAGPVSLTTSDQRGGLSTALAIAGFPLQSRQTAPRGLGRRAAVSGLLTLSQFATAAGYAREKRQAKKRRPVHREVADPDSMAAARASNALGTA